MLTPNAHERGSSLDLIDHPSLEPIDDEEDIVLPFTEETIVIGYNSTMPSSELLEDVSNLILHSQPTIHGVPEVMPDAIL